MFEVIVLNRFLCLKMRYFKELSYYN